MRGKVDYADYIVVMSGRSDRQVNAIAQGIQLHMKKNHGVRCLGVEGLPQGSWALMDFGDVVVHVFLHGEAQGRRRATPDASGPVENEEKEEEEGIDEATEEWRSPAVHDESIT